MKFAQGIMFATTHTQFIYFAQIHKVNLDQARQIICRIVGNTLTTISIHIIIDFNAPGPSPEDLMAIIHFDKESQNFNYDGTHIYTSSPAWS